MTDKHIFRVTPVRMGFEPLMLIMSQTMGCGGIVPMPHHVERSLRGDEKAYFEATWSDGRRWVIGNRAKDQT